MKQKENYINKIQRTYRVRPSQELQEFWKELERKGNVDDFIPFRYFKIKLFTLQQVADFDPKDFKFWFKHRGRYLLVRYFIPLATSFDFSSAIFVAAYDEAKNYIGVFLVNQEIDPIFITSDLFSLLGNKEPNISKKDFIEEQISEAVRLEFDFEREYPLSDDGEDYYHDISEEEKAIYFDQKITEILAFLELVYSGMYTSFKFDVKRLEKSFKISFIHSNPEFKSVRQDIEVPREYEYLSFFDIILPILNGINYQWWNEDRHKQKKYGFYRIDGGIAMLHLHQLCELTRSGVIPHFLNVEFPSIVFSTHPSGFESPLAYEIKHFKTQEEYDLYIQQYNINSDKLSVRQLEIKDIPHIVNYFLEMRDQQLLIDGFDLEKIPFEEELIEELKISINSPDKVKKKFILILQEGGKDYGHCHLIRKNKAEEAYFDFYNWKGMLNREKVVDGLLKLALEQMIKIYNLKTIYAEITKGDEYRDEAFKRSGFEFIKENKHARDSWSQEQVFNLLKLDCSEF